ncbi:MAG: hypothetical protein K8R79_09130 [Calditrichales bacterium]|nr:hypothetical protein [Calditrichales bacterium]
MDIVDQKIMVKVLPLTARGGLYIGYKLEKALDATVSVTRLDIGSISLPFNQAAKIV